MLYVPPFWSVHTETLQTAGRQSDSCMALIVQMLQTPGRQEIQAPSDAALVMQASRSIEIRVGFELGDHRVRDFLMLLSDLLDNSKADLAGITESSADDGTGQNDAAPSSPLPSHWLPQLLNHLREDGSTIESNGHAASLEDGADDVYSPPWSVKSVRLALMAQAVTDCCRISCCLSACDSRTVATMLRSFCDGRLLPTQWLDQVSVCDSLFEGI